MEQATNYFHEVGKRMREKGDEEAFLSMEHGIHIGSKWFETGGDSTEPVSPERQLPKSM